MTTVQHYSIYTIPHTKQRVEMHSLQSGTTPGITYFSLLKRLHVKELPVQVHVLWGVCPLLEVMNDRFPSALQWRFWWIHRNGCEVFSVSLKRGRRGVNSGGEEEAEDEPHTPLPPPMEIIKDPSAQEEKVKHKLAFIFYCCFVLFLFSASVILFVKGIVH